MAVEPRAVDLVKNSLAAGKTRDQVMQTLIDSGYSESESREVLEAAQAVLSRSGSAGAAQKQALSQMWAPTQEQASQTTPAAQPVVVQTSTGWSTKKKALLIVGIIVVIAGVAGGLYYLGYIKF